MLCRVARALPLVAVAASASCILITGGTGGYQVRDAGVDAASCGDDAGCGTTALACVSSLDCSPDAGKPICCLSLGGTIGVSSVCGVSPCGVLGAQLCRTNDECATGSCATQTCSFGGASATLQVCRGSDFCM